MRFLLTFLVLSTSFIFPRIADAQASLDVLKPATGSSVENPFTVIGSAEPLSTLRVKVNGTFFGIYTVDSAGKFRIPIDTSDPQLIVKISRVENDIEIEIVSLELTVTGTTTVPIERPDPIIIKKVTPPIVKQGKIPTATRVLIITGTGIASTVAGLGIVALGYETFDGDRTLGTWVGISAALGLLMTSIWGAGELADGDGAFWATLLGTLIGFATTAPLLPLTLTEFDPIDPVLGYFMTSLLPIVGGITGYELSQPFHQKSQDTVPTVTPVVDSTKATLQFNWRF